MNQVEGLKTGMAAITMLQTALVKWITSALPQLTNVQVAISLRTDSQFRGGVSIKASGQYEGQLLHAGYNATWSLFFKRVDVPDLPAAMRYLAASAPFSVAIDNAEDGINFHLAAWIYKNLSDDFRLRIKLLDNYEGDTN
jgi:hypothetical protein